MVWRKDVPDEKVALFRVRATPQRMHSGVLSAFWEDVRFSMHPNIRFVGDIEKIKKDPQSKQHLHFFEEESGPINYKGDLPKNPVLVSVPASKLAYKPDSTEGAFGYSDVERRAMPLTRGNVAALLRAIKIQQSNYDTIGRPGEEEETKMLWIPGLPDPSSEEEEYERGWATFASWAGDDDKNIPGKVVYWEWQIVSDETKR
jgi:hypothetical protein